MRGRMTHGSRVRFGDTSLYVREIGSGQPLLLINGLGAHTAMWSTLERCLTGIRILEFDLPGAGQSDVPWRPMSIRRLARLAGAVLDHFGVDRADVLGYSMGGVVAQQFAADAPQRIRRLVLAATTPGVGALQGDLGAFFQIMTPARYRSSRAYVRSIGTLTGGRARHDKAWIEEQGVLRRQHTPTWRGYLGQLASMSRWSGLPLLPHLRPPTLVLAGDDDPLTPVANAMMIARLIPKARLVVLAGRGISCCSTRTVGVRA